MSAKIKRPDGRPLGSPEEVKTKLSDTFRGVEYVLVEKHGSVQQSPTSVFGFFLWMNRRRYPYWQGAFHADGYAVEFDFDAAREVRIVDVTFYGMGTGGAKPYFAELSAKTGWQLEFPGW